MKQTIPDTVVALLVGLWVGAILLYGVMVYKCTSDIPGLQICCFSLYYLGNSAACCGIEHVYGQVLVISWVPYHTSQYFPTLTDLRARNCQSL